MTERVRVAPPWVRGPLKHGSPEDRGSADRYYGRRYNPHWHWYSDHGCQVVESEHMTVEEKSSSSKLPAQKSEEYS